jgi:hypothetical protein
MVAFPFAPSGSAAGYKSLGLKFSVRALLRHGVLDLSRPSGSTARRGYWR